MDWNQTKQQIIREAKAKPGKTAVLGILFVVAIWFWAPLVGGWFSTGKSTPAKPAIAETTTMTATATPSIQSAKASSPRPRWQDVVQWMNSDRLMQAAPRLGEAFPFGEEIEEEVESEQMGEVAVNKKQPDVLTIAELGIQLTSTIVGPRRRLAMLNGRPYLEGRRIVVPVNDRDYELIVEKIHSQSVVLASNSGERHTLKIEKEDDTVIYESL